MNMFILFIVIVAVALGLYYFMGKPKSTDETTPVAKASEDSTR